MMKKHYRSPNTIHLFFLMLATLLTPNYIQAQKKSEHNHSKEIITDQPTQSKVIGKERIEDNTGIVRAFYSPNYTVINDKPEEMAKQYLNAFSESLLLKSNIDDLEHKRTIETPGGFKVQFIQKAAGYLVYNSEIKVSINRNNKVVFVTNSYTPIGNLKTNINTTSETAIQTSKNHIGISGRLNLEKVETIVYKLNSFNSVIAYKVNLIPAEDNFGDWELIVDADTGEILRAEDKACYHHPNGDGVKVNGSGWVFDPDPATNAKTVYGANQFTDNNDADSDSLTAQLKEVSLQDISFDGSMYKLEGPYAVIVDFEAPYTSLYEQSTSEFHYTRSNEAFEAVNAYYHLDKSMRYINETLGFDVMPFQYTGGVQFDPHGLNGEINAHYTYAGKIAFGSPANHVDTGEDHAIILHELGHGLHDWITNGGLSQADGLSEGLSDYWAQSYTRSLGKFEPGDEEYDWFGVWGGMPGFGPPSLRVTNFTGHYPENLNGQVHHDGQMWSSSLMSIYDLIGREATDMDCWEGISMLNGTSNQVDAAFAFAQADLDLYGGEHIDDIFDVFHARGYFTSSVVPSFTADQPNGEGPREVSFTDATFSFFGDIVSWEWDFDGDGVIDSYEQNPIYTYSEIGAYTVSLKVSDGETTEILVEENYVTVNGGFFVWDGEKNEDDYSGAFISQYLQDQGFNFIYSDRFPSSFAGFDAVFLSFGSSTELTVDDIGLLSSHLAIMIEYLQAGGSLYVEGSPFFYLSEYYNFPNHDELIGLFGVESGWGQLVQNPISNLTGLEGTINEGMTFNSSNQNLNWYIDKIVPDESGIVSFYEEDYGNVAVYNEGEFGQKTFYFSYILAELVDEDPHSSRYNYLSKVMDFFGYSNGDVVANFTIDETEALPGEEILFTDWSISEEGDTINSWTWDFDEDGIIDSEEQNPVWTYDAGGNYDIMLVVSNGQSTDTLIREEVVIVRSGVFVFEGEENGLDLSGIFVWNYLQDNGYEVVSANHYPSSLIGFDAVFTSFGSSYFTSHNMDNGMVSTLKSYMQSGGNVYLEGTDALSNIQSGSANFWLMLGLSNVESGNSNSLDLLQGQAGTIMDGIEFSASSQFDLNNINIYEPNIEMPTSEIAFIESDHGAVAVQYDGEDFFGQKTFCMSYSLANLQDGEYPNTRDELLFRILNFFDGTTGTNEQIYSSNKDIQLYPNPASSEVTLAFELNKESTIKVEVYNLTGQKVLVELERMYTSGKQKIQIDTDQLMAGTYFYKVITLDQTFSGKLLIVK